MRLLFGVKNVIFFVKKMFFAQHNCDFSCTQKNSYQMFFCYQNLVRNKEKK